MAENTGFVSDGYSGERFFGTYSGTVVERVDPQGRGRIRATIPGFMDLTNWARPRGGGAKNWGKVNVPPLNADVTIVFLNGNPQAPIYEPFDFGIIDGEPEIFPEHIHPDVHVFGIGPFRLVVDDRDPEETGEARSLRLKLVKTITTKEGVTEEQDIAWVEISEENSIQIHADSAIGVDAGAVIDIDAPAVQIKKRKVMPAERPIN